MKFKICHDPERKALSIPRAALQISGLDGQDELHLHADDGCVLLLPERPTAGETVKTIQAAGKKTVGILATDGTVRTGIYQKELEAAGLAAVTPPEDLQKTVMSIIYD